MTDWKKELQMPMTVVFPFVEDENCNITGYGHQDKEQFAWYLTAYDVLVGGLDPDRDGIWTADDVCHSWVVPDPEDDERLVRVPLGVDEFDVPDAIPVTTVWGQR